MESLIATYHLHPIIDHFTIALLAFGVVADILGYAGTIVFGERRVRATRLFERVRGAALVLLIPGALSAVLSRVTGESEAERLWDAISPNAQQILFSDSGSVHIFSHAVLGTYLMYAFLSLAIWRILIETVWRLKPTQPVYLAAAALSICALLYQGKTGGELVYDYAVGTNHTAAIVPPSATIQK